MHIFVRISTKTISDFCNLSILRCNHDSDCGGKTRICCQVSGSNPTPHPESSLIEPLQEGTIESHEQKKICKLCIFPNV